MDPLSPRDVAPLFPPLLDELLETLRLLDAAAWERPTIAGGWRVRDVAAHLLDGDLRKLSVCRDGHRLAFASPIRSDRDLRHLVNDLNASGVAFAARLSTTVIVDLLQHAGAQVSALVSALPMHAPSIFAVSWAGEVVSENWMDAGREYTERWHHQAQIRDAVGLPLLLAPRWFEPLLEFSVRALPVAYGRVEAAAGTHVVLTVTGATVASYTVVRGLDGWTLRRGASATPACTITVDADAAWRLLFNAYDVDRARRALAVHGDAALAEPLWRA